jgi:TonB family protein
MNWLNYLLEANIYLGVFYAIYCMLLKNETFHTLNRVYLLASVMISFILPLMQVGLLLKDEPVTPIKLTLTNMPGQVSQNIKLLPLEHHYDWQDVMLFAYLAGVAVLLVLLLVKLYRVFKLTREKNITVQNNCKLVYLDDSSSAFSFFNYLFIGRNLQGCEIIERHEFVHIKQKHTIDILFLEAVKIINWFNPFVYLLQKSLKSVHEYLADEKAASYKNDTFSYESFLLSNAYGINNSSITHSFFNYNLLKNRIIMLHKKRSAASARLKFLVIPLLCAGMLSTSTLVFSKAYCLIDVAPKHLKATAATAEGENQPLSAVVKTDTVYNSVDKAPDYPGGIKKLLTDIKKNLRYPSNALKNNIQGRVIVSFVVKKDGSVTDVKVVRGISPEIDNEALRIMSLLPKWQPGSDKGKLVNVHYNMPISFKI